MSAIVNPSDVNPAPAPAKKKRVLLVDTSRSKRDLRSESMRKLGAEVDCAADLTEARCWWRADLYDLVLMHVETANQPTDKFCDDIRTLMPQQKIMFLVGKPDYLAASPNVEEGLPAGAEQIETATNGNGKTLPGGNGAKLTPPCWGILEACRRISAARSRLDARSRAIRDTPALDLPQDSESSRSNLRGRSDRFDELIREEMR
jgi:CheY-like chemotaxis protein